ncbi:MAG: hypothetical protein ACD_2C00234G0004 [uncultured bacterium (gcode 4)]|uniref:Uncharacterized protein n=1 Tax=uncultured bacterium (gcode 4) TaxID=1234023 RepID=K2G444_9BACT|nr:MAG: hypothetical protein ACD_2C00234G0004 [uncultured bacterium (gcode 4)]
MRSNFTLLVHRNFRYDSLWCAVIAQISSFLLKIVTSHLVHKPFVPILKSSITPNLMYKWAIIEESLTDKDILSDIQVLETEITPDIDPEDVWHIHTVMMTEENIFKLAEYLKPAKYYAHFWSRDDMFVVFPNKVFKLDSDNKDSWKDAIDFWLSIDIPLEQLDFLTD